MLLPLLALAFPQAPPQSEIDAAIDRGAAYLLELGEPGKKNKLNQARERSGLRALVLYTLLKSGIEPEHAVVTELLRGLAQDELDKTYDAACALLALSAHDPIAHRPWIESLADSLVAWQDKSGAWSYPDLLIDLSNTQYAALGLWAASKAGVEVPARIWTRLAEGALTYQSADGGFTYTTPGEGATGSMTSAGVGVLALCELELALAGELEPELGARLAQSRRRGLDWIAEEFTVETNPRSGAWHYYYLYGLERMGALAGAARVGEHDWYGDGARLLVKDQDEDGSWLSGSDLSDTCFAILFLKRATAADRRGRARATGAEAAKLARASTERDAPVQVAVTVEDGVVRAWIAGWNPDAMEPYEWEGEAGRGPRVRRVIYFVDGAPAGIAIGLPGQAAGRERFPAFLRVEAEGTVEISAQVILAPPVADGGDGSGETKLESPTLAIELPASETEVPRRVIAGGGPNRMSEGKARAKGSSEARKLDAIPGLKFPAEAAIDLNAATPWLARNKDEEPSLQLSMKKAVEVDALVIGPPLVPGFDPGAVARPAEIEVILNGKKKEALKSAFPATGRLRLDLPERTKVKRLEVRLIGRVGAEGAAVGLGEVELRRADD